MVSYDQIHRIKDPFSRQFVRGSIRSSVAGNPSELLAGRWRPELVTVAIAYGRKFADFVWTDESGIVLISERLVQEFEAARFSGWTTYDVFLDSKSASHRHYRGLSVTGRCGPLDYARGEWVRKDDEPGRLLRGLFFDELSWDGSDLFMPAGTLHVFVAGRVHEALKTLGVQNFEVTRLSDVLTAEVVIQHTIKRSH